MLASFWAIYELGYVDNDRIASRYEHDPKLNDAFGRSGVATPSVQPWIWAVGCAVPALFLLRWPQAPQPVDFATWLAVLVITHACFVFYNRFDKATRVWMYSALQVARSACFAVLVPITTVGAVALAAHVLARWMPYYVYRFSSDRAWPESRTALTRVLFTIVIAALLSLAIGSSWLLTPTALAIAAWSLFRARVELIGTLRRATRLDRAHSKAAP